MPLLTPEVAGYVVVGLLIVWLALGVHIGVALGLAGFLGIYLTVGPDAATAQLAAIPFSTTNSFTLAVIPLFILMGSFATVAGIVSELFRTAYLWLGALRGGLAMATVMSSAAFGAASGSTIVNAAVFTRMAMPEMTRFGYDVRLSAGCIAAAGTLAALIPPSILMVIYGVITEQSIGKLLIAGIVPGIVTAFLYCGGIYVLARWRPDLAPLAKISVTWGERLRSLYGVSGVMVLFVIVVGGIYGGYFPATYAGAVGAFGAFVIAFAKRRLTSASLMEVLKDAAVTTSVIFIIVVGGMLFARFLTYSGLVTMISTALLEPRHRQVHLPRRVRGAFHHSRLLHRADRDHGDDPADHVSGDARAGLRPHMAGRGLRQARRDRGAHASGRAERLRGEELLAGSGHARPGLHRSGALHSPRFPLPRALRRVPGDDPVAA